MPDAEKQRRTSLMTASAERMRRLRERRSEGIRVLPVEVSIDTAEVLIELSYLDPTDVRDMKKVSAAAAQFVADMTDAVTRNEIVLSDW